jgi:hypothetical protein
VRDTSAGNVSAGVDNRRPENFLSRAIFSLNANYKGIGCIFKTAKAKQLLITWPLTYPQEEYLASETDQRYYFQGCNTPAIIDTEMQKLYGK